MKNILLQGKEIIQVDLALRGPLAGLQYIYTTVCHSFEYIAYPCRLVWFNLYFSFQ